MFKFCVFFWISNSWRISLQKVCHIENFFFNNANLIKKFSIFASLFKNRYLDREEV